MRDDLSHRGAALIRYLIIYLIDDKLGAFPAGEPQGWRRRPLECVKVASRAAPSRPALYRMSATEDDKLKWTWDPKRGRLVNLTKPALQNKGAPQEGVEGAWRCTGCKNVNFGTRDSCHRCSTPKPPQHILDERIWAIQSGQAPSARWPNGAPKEGVDGNWACGNCGNVNWVMRTTCHRCDADIPEPAFLEKRLEELMAERAEQEQRVKMGIMREQPKEGVKDSWK